jgi:hypothetical protein
MKVASQLEAGALRSSSTFTAARDFGGIAAAVSKGSCYHVTVYEFAGCWRHLMET